MPAQRRYGMDNEYYEWSPLISRGSFRWPDRARVALCVIVNLEHVEWSPPEGSYQLPTIAGGRGPRPHPNFVRFTHREYGHRVGIFRVMDALKRHNIKATVAMDAFTAEYYPYLVRYCIDAGCEIIGHGISVSRVISSRMSEPEERDYIRRSLEALTQATGKTPAGWMGPEYGESTRTPSLLAEAGIQYVCDWANDDQPYPMKTKSGPLVSVPALLDFDDVNALWDRRLPVQGYLALLKEAFDTLFREGEKNGRMMVINLHPWLIGQPFRIGFLAEALGHIMSHQGVWPATGSDIVNWYRLHPPTTVR